MLSGSKELVVFAVIEINVHVVLDHYTRCIRERQLARPVSQNSFHLNK